MMTHILAAAAILIAVVSGVPSATSNCGGGCSVPSHTSNAR
jgi:hypothetical protein